MSPGMKSPATPNLQYHHIAPPPNLEFFFSSLIPMQTMPFSVLKSMVSGSFASASSSFVSTIPWHSPKRDVDRGRCRGAAVCPSTTPLPALLFCSTVEGRAQSNLPLPRSSTWDYSSRFPTCNPCNPSHCHQTLGSKIHRENNTQKILTNIHKWTQKFTVVKSPRGKHPRSNGIVLPYYSMNEY